MYLFSTISKNILLQNMKYISILTKYQEFSTICRIVDIYDQSSAVLVAVIGILNVNDWEIQGMHVLDKYMNNEPSNEQLSESAKSLIEKVLSKYNKLSN